MVHGANVVNSALCCRRTQNLTSSDLGSRSTLLSCFVSLDIYFLSLDLTLLISKTSILSLMASITSVSLKFYVAVGGMHGTQMQQTNLRIIPEA